MHHDPLTNLLLKGSETIVVVDAGGGTIDAVTYKCEKRDPLRLSAEVVAPDCKLI